MANAIASVLSIVFPVILSFMAYWVFFRLPLGARKTTVKRTIPAPRETIWRLVDPRGFDFSWNPHWEQRDPRILNDDPLVIEYLARPKGSQSSFAPRKEIWTRIIQDNGLTSWTVAADDSAATRPDQSCEHLDLIEVSPHTTRVVVTLEGPVRGLYGYELQRTMLEKYLVALDAAGRGRASTACAPSIRFTGWRLAVTAFVSFFVLINGSLFWKPFDGGAYFSAALMTTTLVFALLLHEFGHALALALMGHRNVTISLIPFAGGVAVSPRDFENAFEAGIIAIAGIAFSAVVCLALLPFLPYLERVLEALLLTDGKNKLATVAALRQSPLPWIALCAFGVTAWQLVVNAFNIMPFPGSDGWRVLQSIFSNRRMRWIAAVGVCVTFAALLRSATVLFVIAGFWILSLLASLRSRNPTGKDEVACSERQRFALATIFIVSAICLGFELAQTEAFMARAMQTFGHHHAPAPRSASLTPTDFAVLPNERPDFAMRAG